MKRTNPERREHRKKAERAREAGLNVAADYFEAAALSADEQTLDERAGDTEEQAADYRVKAETAREAGLDTAAEYYNRKIAALTGEPQDGAQGGGNESNVEAAAEESGDNTEDVEAALADAGEDVRELSRAALSADDAAQMTAHSLPAAQYIYARYGEDPREYTNEYALREALRDTDADRLRRDTDDDNSSMARAALSLRDRARLDNGGVTAAGLIREKYDLDPEAFDDPEELRDAIVERGAYDTDDGETTDQFRSVAALSTTRLSPNAKNGDGAM